MIVIAAPGLQVPKEDKPREYITDTPPEGEVGYTVPDTVYYRRRVLDGDLREVPPAADDQREASPVKTKKGGA